jgi:hypothetical protein
MEKTTMRIIIRLLPAALLLAVAALAQTTAYEFRAVVQPGTIIGGHIFTTATQIDGAALNDAGGIAFIASWADANRKSQAAVFTSKRIVAHSGDVVDGRYIWLLSDPHIAINAAGRVAYEAMYSYSQADATANIGEAGIFVEGHLVSTIKPSHDDYLALSDDGKVAFLTQTEPLDSAPRKPSLFEKLHLRRSKKASSLDDNPTAAGTRPLATYTGGRPPLYPPFVPFSSVKANRRGQIVIPVNLGARGFVILLATPVKH